MPNALSAGTSRVLARGAASLLLLASAGFFVAAAWQRWWPTCRRGAYETDACLRLQDHRFDHLIVSEPWTPSGDAAQLAGIAMLLLAGAGAVLPFLLARQVRWVHVPVAALIAAPLAVLGLDTLTSGLTGQVQASPAAPAATIVWVAVIPVVLVVWGISDHGDAHERGRQMWRAALAVALIASTPLSVAFLGPLLVMYSSHDTAPWSDAVIALPLVVAAGVVWKVTPGSRVEVVSRPVESVAGSAGDRPPMTP